MKIFDTSANPDTATQNLLHQLKVKVCKSTIHETLQNHPDYPSILSMSDALKKWKVDNIVIMADKENLNKLPTPYIAHLRSNGGSFSCIYHVSDSHVSYKIGGGG